MATATATATTTAPTTAPTKIYFVYTMNNTPSVGGVTPQGVEIGISQYKNIMCGCCSDALDLLSISEFNPIPCSEDAGRGLSLIGLTELPDNSDPHNEPVMVALTDVQLKQQAAAESLVNKLRKRFNIKSLAGDDGDLLADLTKRVALLERLSMKVFDKVLNGATLSKVDADLIKSIIKSYKLDLKDASVTEQIDTEDLVLLSKKLRTRASKLEQASAV